MKNSKFNMLSLLLALGALMPGANPIASGQSSAPAPAVAPVQPSPAPETSGGFGVAPVAPIPAVPRPSAGLPSGGGGFGGGGGIGGGGGGIGGRGGVYGELPRVGQSSGGYGGGFGGGGGMIDQPDAGQSGGGYGGYAYGGYRTTGRRDSVPPVVVDFTDTDPLVLQEMEEDLSVMGHILDQALERGLGDEAPPSKMGVPLLYTSSKGIARSIYLQGFGALFMVKVNIPLLAPPASTPEKPAKPADSEWESARREVLGLEGSADPLSGGVTANETPFDPEQVETLKHNLINALKNASNIRHLKPDDYVSVAVFGLPLTQTGIVSMPPRAGAGQSVGEFASENHQHFRSESAPAAGVKAKSSTGSATAARGSKRPPSTANAVIMSSRALDAGSHQGTVLTLRVKNSDVSAFASDKMNFEDFFKKVTVNQYAGTGYGLTSVNSWILNGRTATSGLR